MTNILKRLAALEAIVNLQEAGSNELIKATTHILEDLEASEADEEINKVAPKNAKWYFWRMWINDEPTIWQIGQFSTMRFGEVGSFMYDTDNNVVSFSEEMLKIIEFIEVPWPKEGK
jgi:hypothetical protein